MRIISFFISKSAVKVLVLSLIFSLSVAISPHSVSASTSSSNISGEYIAKIKTNVSLEQLAQNSSLSDIRPVYRSSSNPGLQSVIRLRSSASLDHLKSVLRNQVEYIQPNYTFRTSLEAVVAADPAFTLNSANIDRQWGLAKARFPEAWSITRGSTQVTVAVVDTGLDSTHEDFAGSTIAPGYDIINGKVISPRSNSDDNGHGTMVAGVIGATTNNSSGVAGASWSVTLMPVKALDQTGTGSSADVSEAIVWAADQGAKIINLSVGGFGFAHDITLSNAISYAFNKDVVIVAASGNDAAGAGGNLDQEAIFPVCDDNGQNMIIGVTATDSNDVKASFANYGRACIDVAAPGKRILSTINRDPVTGAPAPNSYAYGSGTSLASPLVAGEAALLRAQFPNATNRQIRDRIIATANSINSLNTTACQGGPCDGLIGSGRIDAAAALTESMASNLIEGDLVQDSSTGQTYLITGSRKQPISSFVLRQRFPNALPKVVQSIQLSPLPEGSYAEPLDGTLIKSAGSDTVYMMQKGVRSPILVEIFQLRQLSFASVTTLPDSEVNSWVLGGFLPPPEGSLVRGIKDLTVYWVVGGQMHAVNDRFYLDRGLSIFPVVYLPDSTVRSFPKAESFIL